MLTGQCRACLLYTSNANLIQRLEEVPDEKRTARFVCAMAAAFPDGRTITTRGTIEGRIGYEERGENGFGYDPIFYLPEYGCSTAELSLEKKNELKMCIRDSLWTGDGSVRQIL